MMKRPWQKLMLCLFTLPTSLYAATPLLECTITKELFLGMSISIDLTVYNEFWAGRPDPDIAFSIPRAYLTPDRKHCEILIDYDDSHVMIQLPVNGSASTINGTHDDGPITARCHDRQNKTLTAQSFVRAYAEVLKACELVSQK